MRPITPRFIARLLLVALGMAALAGCAHYTLGSVGKLDFQSLYIAVAKNNSFGAQASEPVTRELRQTFLQEGNLRLADQADADATLDVIISNYTRAADATQQGNTLNAQSYTLTLTANCTLVDNRTGKTYFKDRQVSATEDALVQNGDNFNEAEYQSMAKLARDLSVKIKDTVVTVW
ncbi:MAG TPA: LptE family protein [Opitutales bacterium]|jgi:hypothetical protein|nr:LptE family protein [Opitutales bacterium]